jgi:hypothetical protein
MGVAAHIPGALKGALTTVKHLTLIIFTCVYIFRLQQLVTLWLHSLFVSVIGVCRL